MKRRRRLRWLIIGLGGVLVLGLAALWLGLPALVQMGFERGAGSVGFEAVSIKVDRADLGGLRATEMLLRMGGLDVRLDGGAVDYSIPGLLAGRVSRVGIDGLTVTLDFSRPRRGLLPDALEDLQKQLSGEGELVWPVDELTLQNCRLVLVLPGGAQTFSISATATRQPDGRIAFTVHSMHPEQELHASGSVRTETMSGDVALDQLTLQPGFLLGLADQLALFDLPENTTITSERVELSGTATLADGGIASYAGTLRVPFVRAAVDATMMAVDDFAVSVSQPAGGTPSGKVEATIQVADQVLGWQASPARLELSLDHGRVRGTVGESIFRYADTASGTAGLRIDAGVPPLGGAPQATIDLDLHDLVAGGQAFAPLAINAEGWIDRLSVKLPLLAMDGEMPMALTEFSALITDPLETNRAIEGSVNVQLEKVVQDFIPEGWKLMEPVLPMPAARMDFRGHAGENGPTGTAVIRSTVPHLHLTSEAMSVGGVPAFEATVTADAHTAAVAASFDLTKVETHLPVELPAVNTISGGAQISPLSYASWTALMERRVPEENVEITLKAALVESAANGTASITVRRDAESSEWRALASAAWGGVTGAIGGVHATELGGDMQVDSGLLSDADVRTWMQSASADALFESLLPRLDLRMSVNAAAIEQPGVARAEWAGAWFKKPPSDDEGLPLVGSLIVSAGILRVPPETIEQPVVKVDFTGDFSAQDVTAKLDALVEGTPLQVEAAQHLDFDFGASTVRGKGTFALQPFTLTNSDIASRWVPTLKGISLSATLGAEGTLHFTNDGAWDGAATLQLSRGLVNYPKQEVQAEGLFSTISIDSLAKLRTAPGQRIDLAHLTVGNITIEDVGLQFRAASSSVVHIEGFGLRVFGGNVTAEPFSLYFPDPDVVLDLRMTNLDAGELVRTFDLFRGTLTGRLRGRLPIGLLAGTPIIGQGFLELEEGIPASLSFDAGGLFTVGLPDRTMLEQVNRLPYELMEDGLRNLRLKHFRIDLFRRDRPDVPIAMTLGGIAATRRADVPIELDVRVNGTISELIQHVLQFVMH